VFLEPVQNAGGCFPPPPGYFQRVPRDLRRVRRAAGLGRGHLRRSDGWGHIVRAERFGYQPDMITCAKGITSGYAPLGAMIATTG
jgi:adenosylmethionine-8-amino-7-oxononanoate aminotransferase